MAKAQPIVKPEEREQARREFLEILERWKDASPRMDDADANRIAVEAVAETRGRR